jgi:hypothetical protein
MENQLYPFCMIGGPIHNKVWSVEHYLDAIFQQDYPKDRISLVFYVNDAIDGTKEKLLSILKPVKEKGEYRRIRVVEQNYGYEDFRNDRGFAGRDILARDTLPSKDVRNFAHFARIRNTWLSFLEDEDFIFSIDSDVVLKFKDTLRTLVSHDLDIVGILVNNAENRKDGYDPNEEILRRILPDSSPENRDFLLNVAQGNFKGIKLEHPFIGNYGNIIGGILHRFDPKPEIFQVDMTGACVLIKADIIRKGLQYGPHPIGEDIYFCSLAKGLGYKVWVDGTLSTIHMMDTSVIEEGK